VGTLFARSMRRIAALLLALIGLLLAFQISLVGVAASFESRGEFAALAQLVPEFVREAFGLALASFSGMALLGFLEPLPIMAVVQLAIFAGTEPAGDVETGLVDLLLARPLPRHRLMTRSLLVMVSCIVLLTLTMGAGTWLALAVLAPDGVEWPAPGVVALLMAHFAAVGWCFGGAGLAAGAVARRRGAALAPVAIAAVGLYLLDMLGEYWSAAQPFARVSPFHYFHGAAILAGTARPWLDLPLLILAGGAAVAVAYWCFHRRDL
jgi:ABC-2 type transport system permease protein